MNAKQKTRAPLVRLLSLGLLLFSFFTSQSQAQTTSTPNGNFVVSEVVGCAPFFVTSNNLLGGGGAILYNFENTLNPESCSGNYQADPFSCTNGVYQNTNLHNYSTPGVFYLIQLNGNGPDGDKVSYIKITVIAPVEPVFRLSACTGNQVFVNLDFTQDGYESYSINFGDGSAAQTVNKSTDPDILDYTYLLPNNYDITVQGLVSNQSTTCSASEQSISTLDNTPIPVVNRLEVTDVNTVSVDYEPIDSRVEHTLVIEAEDGSQTENIRLDPNTNSTSYSFNNASFNFENTIYAVTIRSNDQCNPVGTSSATIYTVTTAFSAVYVASDIAIDFDFATNNSGLTQVQFYEDGSPPKVLNSERGSIQRLLSNCTLVKTYYFLADFGAATSKSLVLTPDLNGTLTPSAIQNIEGELINATFKLDFDEAQIQVASYGIYKKNLNDTFRAIGTSLTSEFTDNNLRSGELELCYKVDYTDNCGNTSELSQEFCFSLNIGRISLPNAFTPNGDGFNDFFSVGNGVFLGFQMRIFDRWGNLIFTSIDPTIGWDGNFNGEPVDTGAYVYQVSFLDVANSNIQQTGTLVLIR